MNNDDDGLVMECDTHGARPWNGQVICAETEGGCGRVWHLGEGFEALQPPTQYGSNCMCGKPLHADAKNSAARPVCPLCFDDALARLAKTTLN